MNGEYRNTIDEKGRLMIPPKFREQMGSLRELHLTNATINYGTADAQNDKTVSLETTVG